MVKKWWLYVVILVILILTVTAVVNFKIEQKNYFEEMKNVNDGLDLIHEGKYQEGLAKCHEFPYETPLICYSIIVVEKENRNETISPEFCESIPSELVDNYPLSLKVFRFFERPQYKEDFMQLSQELKDRCLRIASPDS